MNEEEDIRGGATDEQLNQAYKEAKINEQRDPRTDEKFLEERAKQKEAEEEEQKEEPDPSEGVAGTDFSFEQALLTKGRSLLGVGTSAIVRNIYTKISKIDGVQDMITKAQEQLPSISQKGVDEFKQKAANRIAEIMKKLYDSSFDPETLRNAIGQDQSGGIGGGIGGGEDDEEEKKKKKRKPTPKQIRDITGESGQQTLFKEMAELLAAEQITPEEAVKQDTEEENNFNQKQYDIAKQFVFEDKPEQPFKVSKQDVRKLKQQARRPLKLIDVKRVQAKLNDPNITDEVVLNYFQDAKRSELGYGGTAGTIDFLNDMQDGPPGSLKKGFTSVDEFLANSSTAFGSFDDILEDMSFRLETPITKEKLQSLLDGTETYTFQTARMRKKGEPPIVINDAKSLTRAYFARLTALDDIGVFEKGHINAVDQIVERYLNEGIENTASFKDNTAPEISRSIYKLVGGEDNFNALFDEVRDYRVQGITDEDLQFAQVYAGNRTRKADQDLDRIVNAIFGVEPDLESSLLSYVYPEKSLNNLVASDMKVTFAKIFTAEFDALIQNVVDLGGKPENLGVATLQSFRNQALQAAFQSIPPDLSKNMGNMLAEYLRLNKIDVVDDKGDPRF
tara:strand:+ start:60 stop:1916 length:1857 start_codon:yes stop_codon:yes gene_type:complete